ncbi:hypothetical protein Trydic_g15707 [Trypoxylus dichotomus]
MDLTFDSSPKKKKPDSLSPESKKLRDRIVTAFGEYPGKFKVAARADTAEDSKGMWKRFEKFFGESRLAEKRGWTPDTSGVTSCKQKEISDTKQVNGKLPEAKPKETSLKPAKPEMPLKSTTNNIAKVPKKEFSDDVLNSICQRKSTKMQVRPPKRKDISITQ